MPKSPVSLTVRSNMRLSQSMPLIFVTSSTLKEMKVPINNIITIKNCLLARQRWKL